MSRKRRMRLSALPHSLLLASACSTPNAATAPGAAHPVTLSIVSTNDVHGQLERLPFVAGFVHNLRQARARDGGVLLVDAGDAFQGTIESNLNEGAAIMSAYGRMGYAAFTLGNHEFDFGPSGPASIPRSPSEDAQGALKARIAEAGFPVVCANLVGDDGRPLPWKHLTATTEVVVSGVHVGIIGLLTVDAPDVIKRPDFAGVHVTPLAAAAEREATALRARGATVVLVVTHAGGECTRLGDPRDLSSCDPDSEIFRLARALPPGLVDAIFGGHRNAEVANVVAGIPIVHTTSMAAAFSRIDLIVDGGTRKVLRAKVAMPHPVCTVPLERGCQPGDYEGAPVVPDAATLAAIRPALETAHTLKNEPLGVRVEATFPVEKTREMALGNLFADLMREAEPGSDAALGNAGSVRDVLPAGALTFGQLHHVMPFDNQLARLHLTGKEFRALITANLSEGEHGLLSISGVTVDAVCQGNTLEVTLKHPDGAAIRDDESLTVATNDYLALGGDGLLAAAHIPNDRAELDSQKNVLGSIIEGLKKRGTVRPDDPALVDPKRPRIRVPGGRPVRCGGT
ncbi:MAG TPA: bifunctional UDP-sugar hydrolase/5'-nucleotidase [Polyangiaceae bacterium]